MITTPCDDDNRHNFLLLTTGLLLQPSYLRLQLSESLRLQMPENVMRPLLLTMDDVVGWPSTTTPRSFRNARKAGALNAEVMVSNDGLMVVALRQFFG